MDHYYIECVFQINTSKQKKYTQLYHKVWRKDQTFKAWLAHVKSMLDKACCKFCEKEMTAVVTAL